MTPIPTDITDALLQLSSDGYSLARFRRDWPGLVATVRDTAQPCRLQWQPALDRLATLVAADPDALDVRAGLARLAMAVGHPGLAMDCLTHLDTRQALGSQEALLLVDACLQTGHSDRARALTAAMHLRGDDATGLWTRLDRLRHYTPAVPSPWRESFLWSSELLLEPLNPDHAEALAWQYRDPATAELTGLPPMDADLPPPAWIERRLADSPATYAWVHRRLGLVGYGDLHLHRQAGYLCMWVGSDFRGLGLGRALVGALCRLAFDRGLDLVLSSAYQTNQLSIRSLARNGFRTIPVRAIEPDHERVFFSCSRSAITETRARRRLIEFCDLTHTGVRFEPGPTVPAHHLRSSCHAD